MSMKTATSEVELRIGGFRIERRLGAGGLGLVYQATAIRDGRTVALKVIGGGLVSANDFGELHRQIQAAKRLDHPGIAAVFDAGRDGELYYLAMEYIDGCSLRRAIDRLACSNDPELGLDRVVSTEPEPAASTTRWNHEEARWPPMNASARKLRASHQHIQRSCELIIEAALAVDYAHRQGVVHGDIKPGNLLLDGQGRIHIVDFGLARIVGETTAAVALQVAGTPMYMSPEQITGGTLDNRADIYSLGLVLYELLALRPPIVAPTRQGLVLTALTEAVRPLSFENPAVPLDLESVVHKAIAKNRTDRYATMADLAEDLKRFLADEPVQAGPCPHRLRGRELASSRPATLTAVGVGCLLAALACLVVYIVPLLARLSGGWLPPAQIGVAVRRGLMVLFAAAVGIGILGGRRWSRPTGSVLAAGVFLNSLFECWTVARVVAANRSIADALRFLASLSSSLTIDGMLALGAVLTALFLNRRDAINWFAYVAAKRRDFRQRGQP
jgi:serine/threonine protein kinase